MPVVSAPFRSHSRSVRQRCFVKQTHRPNCKGRSTLTRTVRANNWRQCETALKLRNTHTLLTLPAEYAAQGLRNGRVSVRPSVCPVDSSCLTIDICCRRQSAEASGQRQCSCGPRRIDADLFYCTFRTLNSRCTK